MPAFTTAISFAIFFAFSPVAFSASSSSCRRYSYALLDSFAITTSGFENSPMFIPRVSLFPAIFACIILVYHIGETRKSSVLKFIHRFVHIFVDISADTQKPQTKVCGFSLLRLLGSANLRCLFNLDQFACFYIVKYNRKSEYWTLPADNF